MLQSGTRRNALFVFKLNRPKVFWLMGAFRGTTQGRVKEKWSTIQKYAEKTASSLRVAVQSRIILQLAPEKIIGKIHQHISTYA